MSRLADTFRWRDLSGGIVQAVSSDIVTQNSVPFAVNLEFDKDLGLAVSRQGSNIVGGVLSGNNPCRGLHYFRDADASNHKLYSVFNGAIYNTLSGLAELSGLTVDADYNFLTFLDTTLMLNGVVARSSNGGGTWQSSGGAFDLSNIPALLKFPLEWHDRVYGAVLDRLYYTSVTTTTSVSWTGSGSGSIQVEREDGGGTIQGLSKVPGYILIFKERSLKRWNFDSSFPDDLVNIGTQSQKSIIAGRGLCFFFYGPKGFYSTNGSYPRLISRPIQRIIDAISSSYYSKVSGWCDNQYCYWSIGDITINFGYGFTEVHNNVVVRYTIDSQEWTVFKYASEFRSWSNYISGTDVVVVAGDDAGQVIQIDTGTTDYGGVAITYILQSPEFDFGKRDRLKTLADKIITHAYPANGAELQARVDYGQWSSIGKVKELVTEVSLNKPLIGHVFEFRLTDSNSGAQVKLRGLDFPFVEVSEAVNK